MAFGWSSKFRRDSLSDSDKEETNKNLSYGLYGSERSPMRQVTILKNSNNANISPTKLSDSNNSKDLTEPGSGILEQITTEGIIAGKNCKEKKMTDNFGNDNIKIEDMTRSASLSSPVKKSRPHQPVLSTFREINDLTRLECITMENVLECLRERYRCHQYYTYAGPVLLSLNSCLRLPRASLIEDVTKMSWFFIDEANQRPNKNDLEANKSPHVYDIGHQCLRNLVTVGSHQIILISGESGAGKTTATQQLIKYLTENNSRNFGANICSNLDKKVKIWCESGKESHTSLQVYFQCQSISNLKSNSIYFATLILESFGNAKTQANPNSSRFGRLVQLNYSKVTGQIMGAEIQTYLLEKHRVAKYDFRCERNFHIFYYILHGLKYGAIQSPNIDWDKAKGIFQQDLLVDALECEDEEVQRLINAVQAFNMTNFSEIVNILFAMISLLNVVFVPEYDTSSEEEYYSSGLESPYKTEFTVSDKKCTRLAADLLGISDSELVDILIARKITAGGSHRHSIFRKPCENTRECEERLHALTSFIYDRLFSYVLDHLNSSLIGSDLLQDAEQLTTLSLLDLYGFENFHVNHLEQICINYANERLQQINVSIVKSYYEQSASLDEALIPPTELIRIEDELCQRIDELHAHVFAFLDEECLLKRSSEDKDILERMNLNLTGKKSKFIKTNKIHEPGYKFTVTHYATKVEYQLNGMVQKNKDHIPPEFQDILKSSTNPFINSLFKYDLIRSRNISGTTPRSIHTVSSNKNARGKTILTRFKQSVEELMTRLKATENKDVHFIRCIRPNPDLLAGTFSMDIVEKQLHACGIADVVKIAGNGYPIRLYTTKFMTEFPKILSHFCNGTLDAKIMTLIFSNATIKSLKFGKTMVFMSEKCWKMLKKTETFLMLHSARIIQNAWKMYLRQKELSKRGFDVSCTSTIVQSFHSHKNELFEPYNDENEDFNSIDNNVSSKPHEIEISNQVESMKTKRLPNFEGIRPPLYFGVGIASRAPVHTLPIKIYTKKPCLPFAEKPPRRLLANGIQDAFEDYGIVFFQT